MFDQELLERLPSDPEEAFAVFEKGIRKNIPPYREFDTQDEQRMFDFERAEHSKDYVIALAAFLETYQFDIGVNFEELIEFENYQFINAFKVASNKIKFFSHKCAIKFSQRAKAGNTCIYVIEESSKTKIHVYLNKIRELIGKANLNEQKKEALFNRLNAFALEVDKDRTRLEALASFYIVLKTEAKEVNEIAATVEKVWGAISSGGTELWKSLPAFKPKGYLNEPQKKIEDKTGKSGNFDLDDEIPF